jgi:hypothetical protein
VTEVAKAPSIARRKGRADLPSRRCRGGSLDRSIGSPERSDTPSKPLGGKPPWEAMASAPVGFTTASVPFKAKVAKAAQWAGIEHGDRSTFHERVQVEFVATRAWRTTTDGPNAIEWALPRPVRKPKNETLRPRGKPKE